MQTRKNTLKILGAAVAVAAIAVSVFAAEAKKSAAELEKEKALKSPYANDVLDSAENKKFLAEIEKNYVKKYPAQYQAGFKVLTAKCAQCHAASRPLNSQFVEPAGKDLAARNAAASALNKDADIGKNKLIWQVEGDIWQRYVKRMMAKPGCNISKDEGKKIWEFIAYDSIQRKTGANQAAWKKHRQTLLDNFKKSNPARYKELYESSSAK